MSKNLWYSQALDISKAAKELIPSQIFQTPATDAKSCLI